MCALASCHPVWAQICTVHQLTCCCALAGAVDAEAEEKEMQQAALAAAAAAANTDTLGGSNADAAKAATEPHRKRSVEVLNAAAGQHLDAETATEKLAEKSAAQKLSEQIQEQQDRVRVGVQQQSTSVVGQVPDDSVVEQGQDDNAINGQQVGQVSQNLEQQQEQDQPGVSVLQVEAQDISRTEFQQQAAAQAALTGLT